MAVLWSRFFCGKNMDLTIVKPEEAERENISLSSLKDKPKTQKVYEAEKIELSENIQKFDKKPRVYTQNPYDYNYIALRKKDENPTPSASEMIVNPIYHSAAKALGVDTIHDWNKYYDKVAKLVDWAKEKTGYTEAGKLSEWIYSQLNYAPAMGGKKIDDLYIYSRLQTKPKKEPVKTKTIVKKVYIKQKMTQDEMVNRLIRGI